MNAIADPHDAAGRFINAVEDAKRGLERRYDRQFTGLGAAVRHANKHKHPVVRQHFELLNVLVDLRNTIQHSRVLDGMPIAVPREETIKKMEDLARKIENPPSVRDFMIKPVATLSPSDPLSVAASMIVKDQISQMPVYDGNTYVGLFTTNAMARWISNKFEEDGALISDDVTVGQVLDAGEKMDEAMFVHVRSSAYEVCEKLSSSDSKPVALMTTDGKVSGELQGLVSRYDVSAILKKITVPFG